MEDEVYYNEEVPEIISYEVYDNLKVSVFVFSSFPSNVWNRKFICC